MQVVIPGQANTITHDLVNGSTRKAITSGSVTFYLRALTGPNALKWWNGDTGTWSATEVSAGAGEYGGGCVWQCSIAAEAWSYGVLYCTYATEGGDLHVPYSEQMVPSCVVGIVGSGATAWTYAVTDSSTGTALAGVVVWVTNDVAGANVVARDTTDASGQVTFHLKAGTYYVWCQKAGYSFDNPDTEVVS